MAGGTALQCCDVDWSNEPIRSAKGEDTGILKSEEDVRDEIEDIKRRSLSRVAGFGNLSPGEIEALGDMAGPHRIVRRGLDIRAEHHKPTDLCLLVHGWAATAAFLPDGSRQLTSLRLPGDMMGLSALAMTRPIDSVIALTDVVVCDIAVNELVRIFENNPRLALILFLISQEERTLAMERLMLMGQARADARLAALFVRLHERNAQMFDDAPLTFYMPLTQREMGEMIGVSDVHINALIKDLRTCEIIEIGGRELNILDIDRLVERSGLSSWNRVKPDWLPIPSC
ncbi:Crp/Fnr family transcriptional regulator [Qipengyuania sp. JC766]|uniref:Crp/Fnr family transcriptional regulator n=1 Tax=Qipengyuania sp. JC766 TaxID=3232139 RepID=UPI00345986B8